MTAQSEWSPEEFAILLASSEIDADELAGTDLRSRSGGAITVVRQGVKLYSSGQDTYGILLRRMIEFLEKRPDLVGWANSELP